MDKTNVERYLKESCRSFKEAQVKNSARRNSLMKKTLGFENEWKLSNAEHSREERLLREQLKSMQISKKGHNSNTEKKEEFMTTRHKKKEIPSGDVDPYPVTFISTTTSPHRKSEIDDYGRKYSQRRQRRVSREFEDLHLNTSTGKLRIRPIGETSLKSTLSPHLVRRLIGSRSSLSSSDELSSSTSSFRKFKKVKPSLHRANTDLPTTTK